MTEWLFHGHRRFFGDVELKYLNLIYIYDTIQNDN
jgi:hypothetical protein